MITIFVLLGLALLGGGIAAIVDGWPYLVLERGFTQVIIGTVAATGGIILLALSRVLVELRRVKASLADYATVRPASPPAQEAVALAEKHGGEDAPAHVDAQATLPGFGPVAAGAGLVAAGGALAALRDGAADSRDGEKAPASEGDDAPEPVVSDLFEDIEVESEEPGETRGGSADADAEPELPSEQAGEPAATEATTSPVADIAPDAITSAITAAFEPKVPPTEAVSAEEDAGSQDAESHETERRETESSDGDERKSSIWWPQIDTPRRTETETGRAAPDPDDFGSLRQHLTLGPQLPEKDSDTEAEPANPSPEARDTDLDDAAAWMPPAFGQREPPLGEPVQDPDEPAAPRWPPLTAERVGAKSEAEEEPQTQTRDESAGEGTPGELAPEAAPSASAKDSPEDEAASDEEPEVPTKQSGPASSEEGVVGAYQVGDTHFTMYADGSISARTPDGEYSFASMDELKVYLASEKSRLGV